MNYLTCAALLTGALSAACAMIAIMKTGDAEPSIERRHELLSAATASATAHTFPPGWHGQVYEYGGGEHGEAGIACDLYATPLGQGRVHIVAWWKAHTGHNFTDEWTLLILEISNGNTYNPHFDPAETP